LPITHNVLYLHSPKIGYRIHCRVGGGTPLLCSSFYRPACLIRDYDALVAQNQQLERPLPLNGTTMPFSMAGRPLPPSAALPASTLNPCSVFDRGGLAFTTVPSSTISDQGRERYE
jgi:hypothetical protein